MPEFGSPPRETAGPRLGVDGLATIVGSMRELGVTTLRTHADGSIAEVVLGAPPAPEPPPPKAIEEVSEADKARARFSHIRDVALGRTA